MLKRLLLLLLCWTPAFAQAASVRLLSGEYYEGKVELTSNGVDVTTSDGNSPLFIDAAKIFSAVFKDSASETVGPGIMLLDGSILGGRVNDIDGPTFTVGSPTLNVPIADVAWVLFSETPRDKLYAAAVLNRTGAMLANGDFFPGTLEGVEDNRLKVNSVLFGPHRLPLGRSAVAAQLRGVTSFGGQYRIAAKGGSEFQSNDPSIGGSGIALHDTTAGEIKIKAEDVTELHAGSSRYQALARVKPLAVTPVPAANASDAFKVADAAANNPTGATTMLLSTVNTQVSYPVTGGFVAFACSVGVPADARPDCRLIFSVYGDGRLLTRSHPQGLADKPAALSANLSGVRVLTLRVEPGTPTNGPVMGEWIEPLLTKP
jgi:hypothetical protein